MEDASEVRNWGELIPDVLGLVFGKLGLQETLTVVPRVCKSWARAVAGPYCWHEIDIEEWSHRYCDPEQLDRLLRLLVLRSCGSFQRLAVTGLIDGSLFSFVAENARSLQTLVLPRSEISDSIVEQVSSRLSNLTFLDISYCKNLGPRALEAFGHNCKSLIGLRRTMHPLEVADKISQDDEAFAIAASMPRLRHLEVAYLIITTDGVHEILSRCKELEFLDIRGCWEVKLDDERVRKGLKVLGPEVEDVYERSFWDDCSEDYSEFSDYSWEFMDDDMIWEDGEGLEVRFFGDGFDQAYAGFHWPPSP